MTKIFRKAFLGLWVIVTLFLVLSYWTCSKYIFLSDFTLMPAKAWQYNNIGAVHLISYADGNEIYLQNQNLLMHSALNKGFHKFHKYSRQDIDKQFYLNNKKLLDEKLGVGLWIWKPYVILKTLKEVKDNDIIIYLDGGFTVINSIDKLLKPFEHNEIDMLFVNDMGTPSQHYLVNSANRYILDYFNISYHDAKRQLNTYGGIIIIRNTPQVRQFIGQWLASCLNSKLISSPPKRQEYPEYSHHNHDQSLLGAHVFKTDIAYKIISWQHASTKYFRWHHRNIQNLFRFSNGISMLHQHNPHLFNKIDRGMVNNWFARKIRLLQKKISFNKD